MPRKTSNPSTLALILTAVVVAVTIALTMTVLGTGPTAGRVTVRSLTGHCATEDGSAPGQGYPCVWDCLTDGNRLCGPGPVRYWIYADRAECPQGRPDTMCPADPPIPRMPTRHCATPDGATPGQAYPCVWDCLTDGPCGGGPRYLIYVDPDLPQDCPAYRPELIVCTA